MIPPDKLKELNAATGKPKNQIDFPGNMMPTNEQGSMVPGNMMPIGEPGSLFAPLEGPVNSRDPFIRKPKFDTETKFTGGYDNVYGTRVNVGYTPQTNTGDLNVQFPIGSHRQGLNLGASGYFRPGSNQQKSDYGFQVGFSKKITPQISDQAAYNRLLQEEGIIPTQQTPTYQEINYTDPSDMDPFVQQLRQRVEQTKGQMIDEQMGIRPGAKKYGFNAGVDVREVPRRFAGDISPFGN